MNRRLIVSISIFIAATILILIFFSGGSENTSQVDSESTATLKTTEEESSEEALSSAPVSDSSQTLDTGSLSTNLPKQPPPLKHENESGTYTGFVRDGSDAANYPIQNAVIQAFHFPGNVYSNVEEQPRLIGETTSDDKGFFEFDYLEFDGTGSLAYRAEYPDYSTLIKIFPDGDGVDNLALTTFMMLKADTIEGIVVDQYGDPVSKAHVGEIVLEDSVGGRISVTPGTYVSSWDRTDSEGKFKLTGIPLPDRDPARPRAAREFQIPAFAYGYSKGLSEKTKAGDRDVEIQIFKSEGSLFGTVTAHDRSRVSNALVTLMPEQSVRLTNMPGELETVTDKDGEFGFPDLMAGSYVLTVEKKIDSALGFNPSDYRKVVIVRGARKTERITLPEPVKISGTVINEEQNPVEGFIFHTNIDERVARSKAPNITTDNNGTFEFEIYVPRLDSDTGFSPRMPITIPEPWQPGDQNSDSYRLTSSDIIFNGLMPGDELQNVAVILEEGSKVAGVVLEPNGTTPAVNTSVFYRGTSTFGSVQSDEQGRFEFLARSDEELTVEASTELGIAAVETSAPEENLEIRLLEYATVSGKVTGPDGSGMEGFDVRISRSEKPGSISNAVRFEEFSITDAEGKYFIGNVAPDEMELGLLIPYRTDFIETDPILLAPSPGEELQNINFELVEGDYIEGYVYDQNSEPLSEVSLLTNDSRLSNETDENGYFKITGIPTDEPLSFLTANRQGYEEKNLKNVTIYDGLLEIELHKLDDVQILAKTSSGAALTDYRLKIEKEVFTPAGNRMEFVREKVVNNLSGTTEIADLSEGLYRAEVIALQQDGSEGSQRGAKDFQVDTVSSNSGVVEIVVSDGLYIQGTVTGAEASSEAIYVSMNISSDSIQLENATIEGPPWDRKAKVRVSGDRSFSMGPLSPGSYTIRAESESANSEWESVSVGAESEVITLELQQSPIVIGTIIGEDGESVESATVFFAKGDGPPVGQPLSVSNGNFEYALESPGEWRIIVNIDGTGSNQTKSVNVEAGEVADVVFDFSNKIEMTGTLHINGLPAEKSNFVLRSQDGNEAYVRLDSKGLYRSEVTPGIYQPWIQTAELSAPVGNAISVPEGVKTIEQNLSIRLAQVDLLIDPSSDFQSGVLELFLNTPTGIKTVTSNYHIQKQAIRFVDIPVGDYQAVVKIADDTQFISDWSTIDSGRENSMVLLPSNDS